MSGEPHITTIPPPMVEATQNTTTPWTNLIISPTISTHTINYHMLKSLLNSVVLIANLIASCTVDHHRPYEEFESSNFRPYTTDNNMLVGVSRPSVILARRVSSSAINSRHLQPFAVGCSMWNQDKYFLSNHPRNVLERILKRGKNLEPKSKVIEHHRRIWSKLN